MSLLAHGVDVGLGYVEEVGTHAVLTLGAWGVVGGREGWYRRAVKGGGKGGGKEAVRRQ